MTDACRELAYGPTGYGSATRAAEHVWRFGGIDGDAAVFFCERCRQTVRDATPVPSVSGRPSQGLNAADSLAPRPLVCEHGYDQRATSPDGLYTHCKACAS